MGCRGFKTASKLWKRIEKIPQEFTATDYWPVYAQLIHPDQHLTSKALTYTVEGFNSLIRHYLARFRRKSKCYSKSVEMVGHSLRLLQYKALIDTII